MRNRKRPDCFLGLEKNCFYKFGHAASHRPEEASDETLLENLFEKLFEKHVEKLGEKLVLKRFEKCVENAIEILHNGKHHCAKSQSSFRSRFFEVLKTVSQTGLWARRVVGPPHCDVWARRTLGPPRCDVF